MNTCTRCLVVFENWSHYNTHILTATCYKLIKPIRTSTKSKEEIVQELEAKLGFTNFIGQSAPPKPVKAPKPSIKGTNHVLKGLEDAYVQMVSKLTYKGAK